MFPFYFTTNILISLMLSQISEILISQTSCRFFISKKIFNNLTNSIIFQDSIWRIFFYIGHHKTATTWLQDGYFSQHPEINIVSDYKNPRGNHFLRYLIGSAERVFNEQKCIDLFISRCSSDSLLSPSEPNQISMITSERLSEHPYSGG